MKIKNGVYCLSDKAGDVCAARGAKTPPESCTHSFTTQTTFSRQRVARHGTWTWQIISWPRKTDRFWLTACSDTSLFCVAWLLFQKIIKAVMGWHRFHWFKASFWKVWCQGVVNPGPIFNLHKCHVYIFTCPYYLDQILSVWSEYNNYISSEENCTVRKWMVDS